MLISYFDINDISWEALVTLSSLSKCAKISGTPIFQQNFPLVLGVNML